MRRGFSIVEILVSIGIFSIIVFSVSSVFLVSQEASQIGNEKTKAVPLLTEYLEKIRSIRRFDWNLLINDRYIIVENAETNNVELQPTVAGEVVGNYTRYLDIEDACRDATGVLVDCASGTIDPSTKKVTVTISWTGAHPGRLVQTTYLTRYLDNLAWIQTTEADFNAGTHNGTAVTNVDGGEVILGAGGHGDWCKPSESVVSELDLPKNGETTAIRAYEGRAFVGTGRNASGVSLADIGISNDDPPIASIIGTIDGYKTNDVFIESNYGYVATDDNQKEVVIFDLTTYQEIGYFDAPFAGDSRGVFISGNVGYATIDLRFFSFDLSSKTGRRPQLDSIFLPGIGKKIYIVGNYAYIATAFSFRELLIVDISNPSDIRIVGWADVNGSDGQEVFVNRTRAYLATNASSTKREFFIIDVSTKTGSRPVVGSYEANGMSPKGVTVVPGGRAIIVGTGGEEYQVLDITDESNPIRCGGTQIDSGINGVAAVLEADGDAYSYIATGDSLAEFKILEGGPGGRYADFGVFESQTLDSGYSTAFNRLFINASSSPPQSTIDYQLAIKDAVGGDCDAVVFSSFDFVGPDGTSVSRFSQDDAIPLNNDGSGFENPGQCLRIRAYLETSDFSQTPTLYDFSVNYSP